MLTGDRIQNLRKARGISQEELADKIGVSRQAVSKWESGQSAPDIDKIILLSDYFQTTTDYLLKGIAPTPDITRKQTAILLSILGTLINAIGLIFSIAIWLEKQTPYAVGAGLILMVIGTGTFIIGQIIDAPNKAKAKFTFLLPNIWILPFIPLACCFNIVDGIFGGYFGMLAPLPLPGNSLPTYGLYWILYITAGIIATRLILQKKRRR